MPRRDKIGDWRCVERAEGYEVWQHPEYTGIVLRYDPEGAPGERWTWLTGRQQGRARTNGDAFGAALCSAGAPIPRRPSGPSGQSSLPRRALVQPQEAWDEQDAAAAAEGVSWSKWIQDAARQKLAHLHRPTKVNGSSNARLTKRAR
jgi:hypothetical protein